MSKFDIEVAEIYSLVTGLEPFQTYNNRNPRNDTRTVKIVVDNHPTKEELALMTELYSEKYGERFLRVRNLKAVVYHQCGTYIDDKVVVAFKA